MAGHGGTKFLHRMMGGVSVWDISSVEDEKQRSLIEASALRIGQRWILERNEFNHSDDLKEIVKNEAVRIQLSKPIDRRLLFENSPHSTLKALLL
ncbi:MAG: hypothetical protein MK132_21270 [Lentisphaerales bacterium]|nr:hypothetical protein [Lentisphaerales bacterium]